MTVHLFFVSDSIGIYYGNTFWSEWAPAKIALNYIFALMMELEDLLPLDVRDFMDVEVPEDWSWPELPTDCEILLQHGQAEQVEDDLLH